MLREDGGVVAETELDEVYRHADYLAERMGVDHVALGSDFDGTFLPLELAGADRLPALLAGLHDRGWSGEDVTKLAHGNWLRVLRETWPA